MEWTVTKAEVWLTSVDIAWTREIDGLNQRLFVCVSSDKLFVTASQWIHGFKIRSFKLDNVEKRYLLDQSELTALWNHAYFNGETA